ncbi:MAG TPA: hypothetical protein VKZ79_03295 [Alphaproteobacteria bacterium]|nr:hypothetical protein [Alphaproteobacteria bacterium]
MVPRVAAVVLGAVAGIAALLVLAQDWDSAVTLVGIGKPAVLAVLADPAPRVAWTLSVAISAFAVVALLIALVAGFAEVLVARARIDALRHDPAMAGRWNAADWRAAFAHTAIRERAEAAIAALLPVAGAPSEVGERRVIADPAILVDLDRFWLERLALDRVVLPLPNLLLALGAVTALLRYASGEPGWEIALVAGAAGWLAIRAVHYAVRLVLGIVVELAVGAATAAVRPLTSALSIELIAWRAGDERRRAAGPPLALEPPRAGGALTVNRDEAFSAREKVEEPAIAPLVPTAGGVEAVLAEIRAGIEELLAAPAAKGQAEEIAESLRRAIADQGDVLRQAGAEVRGGVEAVAGPLHATLGSIEATERRHVELMSELLQVLERIGATPSHAPAGRSEPRMDSVPNAEVADALRSLLREFDES